MVRLKNRYLLVNILYPSTTGSYPSAAKLPDLIVFNQPTTDALTPQLLLKALRSEVSDLFGDYGTGVIAESLAVKYLSPATSTFIIRVSRAHYRIAWAALSFMNAVPVKNGRDCVFRVVRVSGTMRLVEKEAIRRSREMILRARRELGDQSDAMLEGLLGSKKDMEPPSHDSDLLMVDRSDSEDGDSDGDGDG